MAELFGETPIYVFNEGVIGFVQRSNSDGDTPFYYYFISVKPLSEEFWDLIEGSIEPED